MTRDELIDFMKWYKNTIPIGTQESSAAIVDRYISEKGEKREICPKCGSDMLMEHRYDRTFKICMKCNHNFKL